jgi:hypothetical protein
MVLSDKPLVWLVAHLLLTGFLIYCLIRLLRTQVPKVERDLVVHPLMEICSCGKQKIPYTSEYNCEHCGYHVCTSAPVIAFIHFMDCKRRPR